MKGRRKDRTAGGAFIRALFHFIPGAAQRLPTAKMKITVICDVLGKENNGTTIAAMNLIRSMRERGHSVRVVCPDKERKGQEGVFVVPVFNLLFLNNYLKKNGVSLAYPKRSTIEAAIDGADVVHVMIPFALGRAAARIAKAKGIPVTAGFHCQAENFSSHIFLKDSKLANKLIYRNFYRGLYRYADAVHYPTAFICGVFEHEVGETNHYVISNGVDKRFVPPAARRFEKAEGEPFTVVFTGRYSKEKSHRVLIDAVARSKYAERIQLVFAGSGPLENELKKYSAKTLPVQPIFRFFSRTELIGVLQTADLYVHPAEIEIEAIACLEAISCGLVPVIANSPRSATRCFAISEKNLFDYNEPDSLAERIDMWLGDTEARRRCSEAYARNRGKFDYDSCMDRMERMLAVTVRSARLAAAHLEPIAFVDEPDFDGETLCDEEETAAEAVNG